MDEKQVSISKLYKTASEMTKEEILDWLYRLRSEIYVYMPPKWIIPMENALDKAIEAIKQEPCADCVSRSQALKELEESAKHHANDSREEVLLRRDRDIIRALPSVTPTQEWIPCSDRLPEEKVEVLVTTECGNITIAERYSANDYFINDGAACADEDEIIAWMPLPLPYKADMESEEWKDC